MGDKAQPAARDCCEVTRILTRRCYPHTGNGGHSWCLSSSLSLSVGEAMDVAWSAPQGTHYQVDVGLPLPDKVNSELTYGIVQLHVIVKITVT